MNGSSPTLSIVIPCRNEAAYIEPCVRSMLSQEPRPPRFEIIVADGMSDDGTRNVLRRLVQEDPRVRMVDNPDQIVSTGLNAAIQAARGTTIIRIDAHTEYAPDYLQQCVDVLRETGADNVGGPWVARGKGYVGRAIAAAFQSPFAVGGSRAHDPEYEGEVNSVYLGCWPREIFNRVGFFDEELVRNQDDEFNFRLTRAGGKVWQSRRIRSWYTPRESLAALFRQYLQYGYWKVRLMQKHGKLSSVTYFVPGVFILTLFLLACASMVSTLAGYGFVAAIAAYGFAVLTAAVLTARQVGWGLLPLLPAVFACFHLSFGIGFLRGMLDFVVLRRGPRAQLKVLTRPSSSTVS
jgi:succinoglycan biosynthesis protein ExoA